MGLDMYLTGEKFLFRANRQEDGRPVKSVSLELGYWRKHPNLHGYIVQTFAGGEDECQDIYLTAENLEQIIAAIKARELPHTTGFFFGESYGTDEEAEYDVKIFEGAIEWLRDQANDVMKSVIYRASW